MQVQSSFWTLYQQLKQGQFIDLTHPLDAHIPHPGISVAMQIDEVATIQTDGFAVQQFHFHGQWGTHIDAPALLIENARKVDQITLQEMILPLVVIDIHDKIAENPDYILRVDDLLFWEDQNGRIPCGAFVALRTDWSKRWSDPAAFYNCDPQGISHTPGWSLDALSYLYEECQIMASGQETLGPDPSFRAKETHWMCMRYILSHNHYQVSLLANLNQCPPKGAIIVPAFPKPSHASSFPARVFAICP